MTSFHARIGMVEDREIDCVPAGVRTEVEGGHLDARLSGDHMALTGDPAGLRDLARGCLALSDPDVPDYSKIQLDPGAVPISDGSTSMLLVRSKSSDF